MARAPYQILVFPYHFGSKGIWKYAIFSRADFDCWQGIAGGGEDDETPLQAACWECAEEAGLDLDSPILALDTVNSIPVNNFKESALWGRDVYVIPEHCFGVDAVGQEIHLSEEHKEFRWLPYEEAYKLLTFDGNRTALWELNERLLRRTEHYTTRGG
jgi:dihydroneopterin triphosphate diphosphatase